MFYVFSDSHNVFITLEEDTTNVVYNYEGEFEIFTHAKNLAMQIMAVKVGNYRCDYEEVKLNKAKLSSITKNKVLNQGK